MQDRAQFFYDHAGWSYPSGADEEGKDRARWENARELARAEEAMAQRGWYVEVQDDYDDCADPDDDGETARKLASGEWVRLGVILKDHRDGRHLASLWSVIVAAEDPYVRVVAAELASELLANHDACHARVTCGGCARAWCERCDPAPSALCHWCHGRGWSDAELPAADRADEYA